jgi:hypothetical protein
MNQKKHQQGVHSLFSENSAGCPSFSFNTRTSCYLPVDLQRALVPPDLPVQHGLGEHGLVNLVVPVLAVAHEVDHHVALPRLAPLGRQLERADSLYLYILYSMIVYMLEDHGEMNRKVKGTRLNAEKKPAMCTPS